MHDLITASLSGIFAGIVAVFATLAIERYGGLVGGVLATTPSTIVPASVGIAAQLHGEELQAALFTVPMGMLVSGAFLLCWRLLPSKFPDRWPFNTRLIAMVASSLLVWSLLALGVFSTNEYIFPSANAHIILGLLALTVSLTVGTVTCWNLAPAPKGGNKVSWAVLLTRGVCTAVSITIAVLLSKLSDVAAGLASTFPAIFLTTMVVSPVCTALVSLV